MVNNWLHNIGQMVFRKAHIWAPGIKLQMQTNYTFVSDSAQKA